MHPSHGHSSPVYSTSDRAVSPDSLEALPPKQLARAKDVHLVETPVFNSVVISLFHRGSGHAKFRILGKLCQEESIEILIEGDIGVDIADDVKLNMLELFDPGANASSFRGKGTISM
jgi:hypothetical protein